jgi:hypothetical protein
MQAGLCVFRYDYVHLDTIWGMYVIYGCARVEIIIATTYYTHSNTCHQPF